MKEQDLGTYIKKLVTEKGRDFKASLPQFEAVGHINLSYLSLTEFAKEATIEEQKGIERNLVILDFHNADVFDYLDHLLNVMICETGANANGGYVKTKFGEEFLDD